MFKVTNKDTRTTPLANAIVNFEHVTAAAFILDQSKSNTSGSTKSVAKISQ